MAANGQPVLLYHEKQIAALCGQHCLNTLLQGPYFTEIDLAQIAQDLDALEQSFMAESGMDSEAYRTWQKEASGNVAVDGMFSIQVLNKALENWNLSCTNIDSPDAAASKAHPEDEDAFICNLQEHWLTIKKIAGSWYNFNSLYPAPEFLGTLYLTAFLATLREQGYSIFVVKGQMPGRHPEAGSDDTPGHWFTPEQAKAKTKGAVDARQTGYLKAALNSCIDKASEKGNLVTLKPRADSGFWGQSKRQKTPPTDDAGIEAIPDDDPDLAMAIAQSLGDRSAAGNSGEGIPAQASASDDTGDDPELAAALAASLQHFHGSEPPAQPVEPTEADLAAARLAAIEPGPEPAAGPGIIDVAFRLPSGERIMRRFRVSQRIQELINFLRWKGIDMQAHSLAAFPRRVLSQPQQTLREAGVSNNETLTLVKK